MNPRSRIIESRKPTRVSLVADRDAIECLMRKIIVKSVCYWARAENDPVLAKFFLSWGARNTARLDRLLRHRLPFRA